MGKEADADGRSMSLEEKQKFVQVSQSSDAEPEQEEPEGDDDDIDLDVYGATIFSVIYDMMEIMTGHDTDGLGIKLNVFRMIFILTMLLCNFALQLGMLFWIYNFVVLPSVHSVEIVYQRFHAEVFEDGVWSDEKWDGFDEKEALCGIAFSNFWFMFAILCLWWASILNALRKDERLFRTIKGIAHTSDPVQMVRVGDGEDVPNRVVALTPLVRWILYLVLILPKLFISSMLLGIGTVWLSATDNFADLILNAVALEFVIAIDELLFEAYMPASISGKIEGTKLWRAGKHMTPSETEASVLKGYQRSLMYLVGTLGGVYAFMSVGQYLPVVGVLPGYAGDASCPHYIAAANARVCQYGEDCFPFGGSQ